MPSGPSIQCVCRARAGYRIWRRGSGGTGAFYRCPACANVYDNAKYEHEALPHIAQQREQHIYGAYKELRARFGFTPEQLARDFSETFKPRAEELEARYQTELAGGTVRAS